MTEILRLESLTTGYGDLKVIRDVSLSVADNSITALLGRNGAGKTTLLRAIAGLNRVWSGSVHFDGEDLARVPAHRRRRRGLGVVQENKRVLKRKTVEENLRLGGYAIRLSRAEIAERLEEAYTRFPILRDKRRDPAGNLSGGQQQMLGISQALFSHPRLLLLDEPSTGLAPSIVAEVLHTVERIRDESNCTILLVEQAVDLTLSVADSVAVLDVGQIAHVGRPSDPGIRAVIEETYLGGHAD